MDCITSSYPKPTQYVLWWSERASHSLKISVKFVQSPVVSVPTYLAIRSTTLRRFRSNRCGFCFVRNCARFGSPITHIINSLQRNYVPFYNYLINYFCFDRSWNKYWLYQVPRMFAASTRSTKYRYTNVNIFSHVHISNKIMKMFKFQ